MCTMKKSVFLLVCIGCVIALSQCNKSEFPDENSEDSTLLIDLPIDLKNEKAENIIGKWKLEKITVLSRLGIFHTDCSPYNVVYEFKENGILIVSANTDNYGWHESGEYSFIDDEWGMGHDDYLWGLSINNGLTNWYVLSSKELIIDYSPGDGATFYFVKIGE